MNVHVAFTFVTNESANTCIYTGFLAWPFIKTEYANTSLFYKVRNPVHNFVGGISQNLSVTRVDYTVKQHVWFGTIFQHLCLFMIFKSWNSASRFDKNDDGCISVASKEFSLYSYNKYDIYASSSKYKIRMHYFTI